VIVSVFVPALNTLECALHFTDVNGDDEVNTFWVKNSTAWTPTTMHDITQAFWTWQYDGDSTHSYADYQADTTYMESVSARDMTTQHGFSLIDQGGGARAGKGSAVMVPAGLTKSITSRSGLAGKSYRGRTFVCGMDTSFIPDPENGQVDVTILGELILAFTPLIADITAALATATLVVASRYYQPGGPNTPTVPRATAVLTPILSFGYNGNNYDFQRRRAPGHQRHH
jgi:hypothetical protein